jgi:hypothetical protein
MKTRYIILAASALLLSSCANPFRFSLTSDPAGNVTIGIESAK